MISMKQIYNKIKYSDCVFYFLAISIFFVFLMPFMHYTSLNILPISGEKGKYFNDLRSVNIYLFIDRYYIFYYSLCIVSAAVLLNKQLLSKVIELFKSFSRLTQYAITVFFIFGIISSAFAISPSIAFKGVAVTFLQFFCVLFIATYVRDNAKSIQFFFMIILLSLIFFGGALFLQLSLANYSIYGSVIAGNIQTVLLYMYNCLNPRFLDNYFSWFLPLLFLPWFVDLKPIYKMGAFIALTLSWFILINHAFRTIFAEYIVILPLVFVFARQYFKLTFTLVISALICGYLLDLFYTNLIMAGVHSGVASTADLLRYGTSGRIPVWEEAFWVGISHPLTGIGQWNYIAVTKYAYAGYPHNLLLEIWSQWGITAFIAAAIVIITSIKNLFKNRIEICSNPYYCIFIMMLAAGMIDGMLNAMFKTSLGLFGCVFVFGFCLSIFAKKTQTIDSINMSRTSYLVISLAIIASLFCIVILSIIFPPMWI
ncbi:O-antigen ligase family protein [Francisella halioticida]|uniref:O-antigen ligase family protein n=1 Tax=Francisella halioticida TaxID=549298 RepID=UPI003B84A184